MMKKLIGLLICAMLLLASVVGMVACGGGDDPGKDPGKAPGKAPGTEPGETFALLSTLEFYNWNDAKDLSVRYEGGEISGLEAAMRQFLNDTMGVRPRSKEFLIGYPATILYLMYAAKRPVLWVLTIPLVIGQVSLVNTYAHIHTPLLIALQRSLNGLILGIVVAVIAVLLVKLGIRIFRWATDKLVEYEAR